jgi:hypothetical protein
MSYEMHYDLELGNTRAWKVAYSVYHYRMCYFSIPDEVIFSIYLILLAALGPRVYSASNRNEYQKRKNNNVSGEKIVSGV